MRPSTGTLWLLLGYLLFVVYGSLVPLEFKPLPLDLAWQRFLQTPFLNLGLESRADWVANGVLYAPLGLLAARLGLQCGMPPLVAVLLASIGGSVLGVAVEFTQLFFPGRTVSQNDMMAEALGSVVGATAATLLGGWLDRLGQGWRSGGARLLPRLLELYALSYLLLSFFPYDLLLSAAELQGKWHSQAWAWVLAPQERGPFFTALQLAVETALVVPLGALRLFHTADGRSRPGRALLAGAVLGVLIEVGQFFVATAVSQGVSVLTRACGVMLGCLCLPWLVKQGWQGLRAALQPWGPLLWLAYLPLLAAVNGAFSHAWGGVAQALASWQTTRLLPFYYHYFTSEALALYSLTSVALAYLPVAVLTWARGLSTRTALLIAALLCLLVESAKLFMAETHADPTNILVALAVTAGARWLLALAQAQRAASQAANTSAPTVQPAAPGQHAALALLALPLAAAWTLGFPVLPGVLLLLLVVASVAVWRWPVLALALVPAALPALDLAPWSGRFYWDEFDLLQAVVLAVAWYRTAGPARRGRFDRRLLPALALLALSAVCSAARALWPLQWPDDNSFNSYYSAYNALRILKGAAWAWIYLLLWQRLEAQGARRARMLTAGMALGLALTVAVVVAERVVFAGLLDFAADFRVTGPFSTMHKGGAYIECYLAVAMAFVAVAVLRPGPPAWRVGALLLLGAGAYAMLVTYSRNGYAALLAVLLLALLGQLPGWLGARAAPRRGLQLAFAGGLLLLVAAVALPILGGSYARQRLSQSGQDLGVRVAHWQDGLATRNGGVWTDIFGMGLGRFPEHHFWNSREALRAGSYTLRREGPLRYLRLGEGATLYIEQIVPRPELGALRLRFDWRAASGQPMPVVALCEKWTLTSLTCAETQPVLSSQPPGSISSSMAPAASAASAPSQPWVRSEIRIDASRLLARAGPLHAPLKLALLTPRQGSYDITQVTLETALGDSLLRNGDFSQGLDRWFFATDVDPPWHLHSLPVAVLFDQGWLGVLAWLAAALVVTALAVRALWLGQAAVPAALPALAGFAVSAALNTLIDAPRFLFLLLVLMVLATLRVSGGPPAPTRSGAMDAP